MRVNIPRFLRCRRRPEFIAHRKKCPSVSASPTGKSGTGLGRTPSRECSDLRKFNITFRPSTRWLKTSSTGFTKSATRRTTKSTILRQKSVAGALRMQALECWTKDSVASKLDPKRKNLREKWSIQIVSCSNIPAYSSYRFHFTRQVVGDRYRLYLVYARRSS